MFYAAHDEPANPAPAPRRPSSKRQVKPAPAPAPGAAVTAGTPAVSGGAAAPPPPRAEIIRSSYDAAPLGLRYAVLKRVGDRSVEVSPTSVFHSGERIQVAVEVNDSGYLYIVTQGSSGNWEVLFPSAKIEHGENRVERGRRYVVPQGYVFTFAGQPGAEKLFIIFSRQPESEIDRLIYSLQGAPRTPTAQPAAEAPPATLMASAAPINDALIGQFREMYSRDLIIEKADDSDAARTPEDKAVYVVNPKGAADSRVVADIQFTHQ
jgi:hypothetical protein